MATDFGTDISTFPDLDPTFTLMFGTRVVGEAVARRLMTPRGALTYDSDYGFDLREYLNASFAPRDLVALQRSIEAEAVKDERVFDATATVSLNAQTKNLDVRIALQTSAGPFTLVLAVGAVTLAILKSE